jgi:hypothetical protein
VQESINHELNLFPQVEGQFMNIIDFSGFVFLGSLAAGFLGSWTGMGGAPNRGRETPVAITC